MNIEYKTSDIVEFIFEYLEIGELNEQMKKLRREFDLNPFNEDDDEYVGAWEELRHNMELINDVIFGVINVLERLFIGGQELKAPEKLDIAVAALDKALVLPWYAEMFDGPALKLLVSQAVTLMNVVGWDVLGKETKVQSKAVEFEALDATEFVKNKLAAREF